MAVRNAIQRRLRRSKDAERRVGKFLLEHDGEDPRFRPGNGIVTSTGRVGHVTEMQIDVMSKSYAAEVKNIRVWAGLWSFWTKIVQRAWENSKEPVIVIIPTNEEPDRILGRRIPDMHILTGERHAQLLAYEHAATDGLESPVPAQPTAVPARRQPLGSFRPFSKEDQLGQGPKKGRSR